MAITPDQRQVIRECAKDDDSFQRLIALIDDIKPRSEAPSLSQAQMTLNLDEAHINLLVEVMNTIPAAIYVKDRDSRFVLANRLTWEAEGLADLESLIGKTDFDLTSSETAQRFFDEEQALFTRDQPIGSQELFVPEELGGPLWILVTKAPIHDHQGHITGLIGINRDITERKLAETTLAEERNLLRTIINNIPDKIYIKDRQSRFVLANPATWEANRLSSIEQLADTTDFAYMDHERAQRHFDSEQALMDSGQPIINQELFVPEELSGPEWFLVTKVPIYDDDGQVNGLVGINHDITSHKLAAQKSLELALERERSRILADFISDASHEFRTVVTIIQSSAYLLHHLTDLDQQQQQVTLIADQLNNLLHLIDNLITMSRLDRTTTIDLQETRLDDVLQGVVAHSHSQAERKALHISVTADDTLPAVSVDKARLNEALACIMSNAIDHTPAGGDITLRAYAHHEAVVVEISDTGIGMSQAVQRDIFKRFYRVDRAHTTSGFGLGLPIAQRIVELHQGRIEVESEPEKGSTFRVVLPVKS